MFVTIDRAAMESAIAAEYSSIDRDRWVTAECRYGVLAVCDEWDDAQEAIMNYVERNAEDEDDEECLLAECAIRPATDQEVIDKLVTCTLGLVELGAQCSIDTDQFKHQVMVELVTWGYPENGFIRFDETEPRYRYYDGDMRFEVSPLF